jgi:N-acetylglucosamine-6-sulfatase
MHMVSGMHGKYVKINASTPITQNRRNIVEDMNYMKSNQFMGYVKIFALLLSLIYSGSLLAANKPNLVFILTDDHRYDMLSLHDSFPFIQTPNIDRIANEGALFNNAFVTTSVCSPSRASFLTGAYAHRHGVIVNAYKDPSPENPIFPALLRKAGYETAFIGKWHMEKSVAPREGFDHWVSFSKQGKYFDNDLNINGETVTSTQYITDELTDRAIEYIGRTRSKPFALYLSHKAIHAPFIPAQRHSQLYHDAEIRAFQQTGEDLTGKPEWLDDRIKEMLSLNTMGPSQRMDMIRALSAVDESVGQVFKALEENEILDTTAIVFAGDNGYFFGEHGVIQDKRMAYEPSIRIPLMMRYPPAVAPGSLINSMVLNIDLAPTLLELTGTDTPDSMQGKSWMGLLREEDAEWRDRFLYEYYSEADYRPNAGNSRSAGTPTIIGLRTKEWKYITYPELENEKDELYRLSDDPDELFNLAQDPGYSDQLQEMKGMLTAYQNDIGYQKPVLSTLEEFCIRTKPLCNYAEKLTNYF